MGLFQSSVDLGTSPEDQQKLANLPLSSKLGFGSGVSLDRSADQPNPDAKKAYDDAVENHDSSALIGVAKNDPASPLGATAVRSAQIIEQGKHEIAALTAPIEKAGLGTPEANIAAAKTFETVKDHPKYGTALVRWIMGDKAGAAKMLTGGDETDSVVWDADGNSYTQTTNALGQRVGIVDANNNPITRQEADARKIGYSAYENTIAAKNRALNAEKNTAQFAKDTQVQNTFTAGSAADAMKGRFIRDALAGIPKDQISSDFYSKALSGISQTLSQNQTASADSQKLDSYSKAAGSGQKVGIDKGMTSRVGWDGVFSLGSDGKLTNEKGETHSLSELEQKINSSHSSKEQGSTFNRTLESVMAEAQLKGLTPEAQAKLRQALVYSKEIADQQAERLAAAKELGGRPAFTVLPSASNITDRLSQVNAQTIQLDYNDEAMSVFNDFKKKVMPQYEKTGSYPPPRELEAQFVRTPEYKALQEKYAKLIQIEHKNAEGSLSIKLPGGQEVLPSNEAAVPPAGTVAKPGARPPLKDLRKAAGG